jgi:hypothetical protein
VINPGYFFHSGGWFLECIFTSVEKNRLEEERSKHHLALITTWSYSIDFYSPCQYSLSRFSWFWTTGYWIIYKDLLYSSVIQIIVVICTKDPLRLDS